MNAYIGAWISGGVAFGVVFAQVIEKIIQSITDYRTKKLNLNHDIKLSRQQYILEQEKLERDMQSNIKQRFDDYCELTSLLLFTKNWQEYGIDQIRSYSKLLLYLDEETRKSVQYTQNEIENHHFTNAESSFINCINQLKSVEKALLSK